jgi:hypothetical protein
MKSLSVLICVALVGGSRACAGNNTECASGRTKRFYRAVRTGVSAHQNTGIAGTYFTTVGGGSNIVKRRGLFSVDERGITVSGISRPSQMLVLATFAIDAGAATGLQRTIATAFTVN